MAVLKPPKRSAPLTAFSAVSRPGANVFDVLAETSASAFEILDPIALEEAERRGKETGYAAAGETSVGFDYTGDMGDMDAWKRGVSFVESGGRYDVVGPQTPNGDRAYGKYQVMDFNVGPWTEKHYGKRLTPGEFLANQEAQERVFEGEFWQNVVKYGNPDDAASVWFSGRPVSEAGNATDGYTTVPQYITKFRRGMGMVGVAAPEPQVQVRNEKGEVALVPADRFSSRYQKVERAAATAAYSSRVLMDAETAFMDISRQFPLNATGFEEAADAYIRSVVENAPADIRVDLGASMQQEAIRRLNGIKDAKYKDTINRASNETAAIVERYSQQMADAIALGDMAGAEEIRSQMDSVLRYRETIPGLSWTREQSLNAILSAERQGEVARQRLLDDQEKKVGGLLDDMGAAFQDGRAHVSEGEIDQYSWHPDYEKVKTYQLIRDAEPGLWAMTPDQRKTLIEEEAARPVSDAWENDVLDAMRAVDKSATKALKDDPIAYSQRHMANQPPGDFTQIESLAQEDIPALLAKRAQYALAMETAGYVEGARFFSNSEIEALKPLMAGDPVQKAALAGQMIAGMGAYAPDAAAELGFEGAELMVMGSVAASGNTALLGQVFRGQAMLVEGQGRAFPKDLMVIENVSGILHEGVPVAPAFRGNLADAAKALLAAQLGTAAQDATKREVEAAMQKILGQTQAGRNGVKVGGVQRVLSSSVLLPPGVSSDMIEDAMKVEAWTDGAPYLGGEPVGWRGLQRMTMEPVVQGGQVVTGMYLLRGNGFHATTEDGKPFILDVRKLLEGADVR